MAEAIAVFGVISGAIGLLNLIRLGYNGFRNDLCNYREVGSRLVSMNSKIDGFLVIFQEWRNFWCGKDNSVPPENFEIWWGMEGTQIIKRQLAEIDIRCLDIATLLRSFISTSELDSLPEEARNDALARVRLKDAAVEQRRPRLQKRNNLPAFVTRAWASNQDEDMDPKKQQILEFRALADNISRSTSIKKKLEFVNSSCERLEGHFKRLWTDWNHLKEYVDSSWRKCHIGDWKNTTFDQRQLLALEQSHANVLVEARLKRPAIRTLYGLVTHDCFPEPENSLRLEMDLLDDATHALQFRFVVGGANAILQGLTVMPYEEGSFHTTRCYDHFCEAWDMEKKNGNGITATYAVTSLPAASMFRATARRIYFSLKSPILIISRGKDIPDLTWKLIKISSRERLNAAHQLVQAGLILLGTSWLSNLTCKSVLRWKQLDQAPRYLIWLLSEFPDSVFDLINANQHQLEPQTFRIGILLVELALRTFVVGLEWNDEGLRLLIGPNAERFSRHRVALYVENEIGLAYAEAVRFCLQDAEYFRPGRWLETWRDSSLSEEEKYVYILDSYYQQVVIKIAFAVSLSKNRPGAPEAP